MHDLSTTLAAIATPPGRGGVGCVRLSGPDALRIARGLFRARRGFEREGSGGPAFGLFLDARGAPVDHGYLVTFPAARSFTGEPTAELWPHGSPPVLEALVAAAVASGAIPAGPGEFTYRALRHGRLDLARAEAVRDLIAARTLHQARVAFAQVEGEVSRRLAPLKEALIDLVARAEASLEFADEAETHLQEGALERGLRDAARVAGELLAEARRGRVVREGARVALTGVTSVGKSSLFNRLLGRDRAIVSPVAGTTRDTLEDTLDAGGIPITLVDTAGLRPVDDPVEAEGVRRARAAASEADLLLIVLDGSRPLAPEERDVLLQRRGPAPALIVVNKTDLAMGAASDPGPGALYVSARTGAGIEELLAAIREAVAGVGASERPAITNIRHEAAIRESGEAIERAITATGLGTEFAILELRQALDHLGTIAGEVATDDLYHRIFSTFCIGK